MSNRAAFYLRSSKDRSDVSIDVQRRQLTELATSKRLIITTEYADAVESGKDDDRPGFQALLRAVEQRDRGWEQLLVLDTSRIARRVFIISAFEHDCEKHGITVVYKNLPDMEPAEQMLFKTIMQGMDQYHSLKSRAKGLAGMAENVRQGWRAGGRAPRGYQLEYHATGAMREGTPVLKSKLIVSAEAGTVAAYLRGRAAGKSRGAMVAELKLSWPIDSLNGMEWQALTYAGHTVWNVHNERTTDGYKSGEKRRPRSEWMINRNTHDPLISDTEAEAILRALENQRHVRTRTTDRPYLLTGLLVDAAGQPWHGEWDGKMDAALYRLGRGKKIAARRVDDAVLAHIRDEMQTDAAVDQILRAMKHLVGQPVDGRKIATLEKRLSSTTTKISRLVDLMATADAGTVDAYRRSLAGTEQERAMLVDQLDELRSAKAQAHLAKDFTRSDARRLLRMLFDGLETTMQDGDITGIKTAIANLVEKVELDPETSRCSIHYRVEAPADTGFILASPGLAQPNPVRWVADVGILARRAA